MARAILSSAEATFTQMATYSEGGVRVVSASATRAATSSGGTVSSPSEYCRTQGKTEDREHRTN